MRRSLKKLHDASNATLTELFSNMSDPDKMVRLAQTLQRVISCTATLKQGATGPSANKAQKAVEPHVRSLSRRGILPNLASASVSIGSFRTLRFQAAAEGSDRIRTEFDPVRRILDDMQPDLVRKCRSASEIRPESRPKPSRLSMEGMWAEQHES
jgi:hypothetical protein